MMMSMEEQASARSRTYVVYDAGPIEGLAAAKPLSMAHTKQVATL